MRQQLAARLLAAAPLLRSTTVSSSSSSSSVLTPFPAFTSSAASLHCSSLLQQQLALLPHLCSSSGSCNSAASWSSSLSWQCTKPYSTSGPSEQHQKQDPEQQQDPAKGSSDNDHHHQQQQQQHHHQQQQEEGGRQQSVHEQAQEVSQAFLMSSLNMEELWMSAVAGKLKIWSARQMPDLKGKEQEVVDRVRNVYLDTLARAAAGRVLSHRARTLLKQACLAVATYKVLLEVAPHDAQGVEQHIADAMGGLYAPFLLGGLKLSSWAKRLLLRHSSISQAVDTLHTLARDMEGACHVSVQPLSCSTDSEDDQPEQQEDQQQQQQQDMIKAEVEDPAAAAEAAAREHHEQKEWTSSAALTVDSCMIAELMQEEGVPQLLKYFCCQHNMSWLEVYERQGVQARLEACIGKGDACCRMTVTPA